MISMRLADQIAELYKRRWQIELFFRWVKHSLKIRHFFGTSENCRAHSDRRSRLIAFLLLRMAHALQNAVQSLLTFTRLVATNPMHATVDPAPARSTAAVLHRIGAS